MLPSPKTTADPKEIDKFSKTSEEWWNPEGKFAPLHQFNPTRLTYIRNQICNHFDLDSRSLYPLKGLKILDVGCGGGLISEPLARMGASVMGIDASKKNIEVALSHAKRSKLEINYKICSPENIIKKRNKFDVVVALEVIEHVSNQDLFIKSCAKLVNEKGTIFLGTLNRTPKSFLLGIIGAEYIMGWLPIGTHSWNKFVKPSELASQLQASDVSVNDIAGFSYSITKNKWFISRDVSVNYILFGSKIN